MIVYLINLLVVVVFSSLAMRYANSNNRNQFKGVKANIFFMWIPIISMSYIASIRYWVGTDYGNYKDLFYLASNSDKWFTGDDVLFSASLKLIDNIFHDDKAMFAIYGSLIVILGVYAIRNISNTFAFSMFLFVAMMFYYNSFNGIRQWFVSMIMFLCYPLYCNKKYKILIPIIIVCYFMHSSVIYYVLVYFIVKSKAWGKVMASVIAGGIAVYLFFAPAIGAFLSMSNSDGRYSTMYGDMLLEAGSGANILRLVVACIPVVISFVFYKQLKRTRKDIDILINFSVINMLLMLLATRHWLFARFSIYFDVYNIILIPQFVYIFKEKDRKLVRLVIYVLFFFYMYVLLHVDSELLPYKTIYGHYFP